MSSIIVKQTIGGKDFHLVFVSNDLEAMPQVFTLDEIAMTVLRTQMRIQGSILTQREHRMLDALIALLQGLDKVDRLDGFSIVGDTDPEEAARSAIANRAPDEHWHAKNARLEHPGAEPRLVDPLPRVQIGDDIYEPVIPDNEPPDNGEVAGIAGPSTIEFSGLDTEIRPGWAEPPDRFDPAHKGMSQEWGYFSKSDDKEPPFEDGQP